MVNTHINGNAVLKSANDGHIDYASFAASVHEKLFSELANCLLKGVEVRIPTIDIVQLDDDSEPRTLSYNVADDGAQLFLMENVLFSAEELIEAQRDSQQSRLSIEQFLERVREFIKLNIKMQVQNEPFRDARETLVDKIERKTNEQYANVEKEILTVLLMDSILNNADRHGCNWALVLDKDGNWHVAIWDHETSMLGLACTELSRPSICWGKNWNGFAYLCFSKQEKVDLERRKKN